MTVTWARPVPYQPEVWLFLGDSTCAGVGLTADEPVGYPPADSTLWMIKDDMIMTQLAEPCGSGVGATGVGPAGLFAWYRQQRVGGTVLALNCGIGGRVSANWAQGQAIYNNALARVRRALAWPGAVLRGFVCCDGANDAFLAGGASSWRTNWTANEAALRSDIGAAATGVPWFYERLPPTAAVYASFPSWSAVLADQLAFQSSTHIMIQRADAWSWVAGEERVHLTTAGEVSNATLIDTTVAANL